MHKLKYKRIFEKKRDTGVIEVVKYENMLLRHSEVAFLVDGQNMTGHGREYSASAVNVL